MPPSEILETFYHFSITRYNLFIYVFNKQGDLGFLNNWKFILWFSLFKTMGRSRKRFHWVQTRLVANTSFFNFKLAELLALSDPLHGRTIRLNCSASAFKTFCIFWLLLSVSLKCPWNPRQRRCEDGGRQETAVTRVFSLLASNQCNLIRRSPGLETCYQQAPPYVDDK